MRYDIKGMLKNALERGATLEGAMHSIINAGYNVNEVRQAASSLKSTPVLSPQPLQVQSQSPQINKNPPRQFQRTPAQNLQSFQNPPRIMGKEFSRPKYRSGDTMKIIILSAILVILIIFLIFTALFRENVINFLSSLF